MKLENGPLNILLALFAVAVISTSVVVPALAIRVGESSAGADYAVFEGVAGNDYYRNEQYSYKINQWYCETGGCCDLRTAESIPESCVPSFEDDYFNARKSLRIGYTEYGEIATPVYAGLAYGANAAEWAKTESWASQNILPKYWIQGWVFYIDYTRQGVNRAVEAWAIYSDLTTTEAGRKAYSWYSDYQPNNPSAQLTLGTLTPDGVKVLYDSARLSIGRTEVVIHDGYFDEDVAKVVLTIVFNKDTKYAIVFKDVKILLDTKILDKINDFAFTERYELDLARGINPSNRAFIHYYSYNNESEVCQFDTVYQHPLTGEWGYDVVQAYNQARNYTFFAGYWPVATEYTVYNPLVPSLPVQGLTRILPYGTAVPDIPAPPAGPGEPSTPWVIVQWRYNSSAWPNLLSFLAKSENRQIRFVEVIGMTDFNGDCPVPAADENDALYGSNEVDMEVQYLLNQVFNPEDLNDLSYWSADSEVGAPFMWIGLGQSAATTDSAGAAMLGGNLYGTYRTAFPLFDRHDELFPWIAPVIGMRGTIPYGLEELDGNYIEAFSNADYGTGPDTTTYMRTFLKDFAFDYYDDDCSSPPQPIRGGWSCDWTFWYPAKDPLTERHSWLDKLLQYDDIGYHPNGILTVGGMKANGLTRYFNDFYFAISREGTGEYGWVDGGVMVGTAPTSDPNVPTFDYFPVSTWKVDVTTFGYTEGYAVIALARDIDGVRGLSVYGWDGRDTFWASAWASQYIIGGTDEWMPDGVVAIVLHIDYDDEYTEPTGFTVVKALGTITEFGDNYFTDTYGYDSSSPSCSWEGTINPPEYPEGYGCAYYPVWWFEKLPTDTVALVEFDQ